ncbi:MAG: PLP-dependent aspartate aminotransferase family protein [Acidobacteria bacterium]|nr:PLP-dependent aspartate aminotransferase family protein [Acidobacteriota bacterium]MCZ6727796.1 PLP-dependent aspartate aminotransferase family protein [Acidobacteriota bacterium]
MKGDPKKLGFSTRAIHAGQEPDPATGAINVPIYATSTYVQDELGKHKGYEYARVQNPTREALERNIASLEGGLSGHAYASGMAAISTLMTMVKAGEHIVASHTVYGGTYRLLTQVLDRYDLQTSWVDTSNLDEIEAAMTPQTRMLFVETPTNPMMGITDLAGAAEIAHRHGAVLAVDNTFASPYFQRPLEHGADIVMHSATKFLNGHSDALGGLLVAARPEDGEWFAFVSKSAGAVLGPFDAYLTLRGIKTLEVRMERHEANGRTLADYLDAHGKVGRVFYPGLAGHPGHDVHRRQASGFGALISFDVGSLAGAKIVLDRVRVMSLAESLGGIETLISHPATMTHAAVPTAERQRLGIVDGLVRLSVGLENVADLLADLEQALAGL